VGVRGMPPGRLQGWRVALASSRWAGKPLNVVVAAESGFERENLHQN